MQLEMAEMASDHCTDKLFGGYSLNKPLNIQITQSPSNNYHVKVVDDAYEASGDTVVEAMELLLDLIITSEEIFEEKSKGNMNKYQRDEYRVRYFTKCE